MQRLYIQEPLELHHTVELKEDHVHYLLNVLRFKEQDELLFFNGKDGEFLGKIFAIKKKSVHIQLIQKVKDHLKTPFLKLIFSPIKQDRLNFMIEKATELGVTHFQPVLTEYTQVRKLNIERLQKIAIEASEQSERCDIPVFLDILPLNEYIQNTQDLIVFCCERHHDDVKKDYDQKAKAVLIGPEGGFSPKEKEYLMKKCTVMSLGNTILRAETAAIIALDRIR